MPKYMILLSAIEPAREQMARSTPEQMQASMSEWMAWKDEAEKQIKFQFGSPMQAVARINASEVTESDSQVTGYFMIEADTRELALGLLPTHPHLKRAGAGLEVLEMVTMPGMSHRPDAS